MAPPTKVLFLFTFFTQFVGGLYAAWEAELPTLFQLLYWIAFIWLLWWWIKEDSKRTGVRWPSTDLGFLLFLAWFAIIPYHLFSTRGLKGFIGILSFMAVLFAGWLAAVLVIFVYLAFVL